MEFFRTKTFIILLCVALVLVIVPSVLSVMGLSDYVRGTFETLLSPFQHAVTYVSNGIGGFFSYFSAYDDLAEENRQLKEQLSQLQDKVYNAELIEDENEWLRGYIGLRREHIDYTLEAASVIGRESGSYLTIFTLNRGTFHDVGTDLPVITEDGVVGYITEVGPTWSKVVTIIESSAAIGAYIERTGQLGLVAGSYELRSEGLCAMTYIPADADIKVGDRVKSSGLGSIYPPGLMIGEIVEIQPDSYSRNLIAKIRPSADLSGLQKAMIITDYDITNK